MAGLISDYYLSASGAPAAPPNLFGREWGWQQDEDNGDVYIWSPESADWSLLGLSTVELPKRATLWHEDALFTVGGGGTLALDAVEDYLVFNHDATPADGDTFTHSFWLEAGSYTLSTLGLTANNRGKLDWYIDNVLQGAGGQDWYSAGSVYNVILTLAVTVAGTGYHQLKGVVNGKNASSSNYYMTLTKYWLAPAAD